MKLPCVRFKSLFKEEWVVDIFLDLEAFSQRHLSFCRVLLALIQLSLQCRIIWHNTHLQIRRFLYLLNLWVCYWTATYTSRELMTSMSITNDLYFFFQSCKSSVLFTTSWLEGHGRHFEWTDRHSIPCFLFAPVEWTCSQTAEQKTPKLIQLARFRLATCLELKKKRRQCTIRARAATGIVILVTSLPGVTVTDY